MGLSLSMDGRRGIRAAVTVIVAALVWGVVAVPPVADAAVTPCSNGTVALTFDDGPNARSTPKVLDVLKGRKAKATFFQIGSMVAANPSITRRVHAEGHVVANHTYNHENLTRLTNGGIRDTITRANRRITAAGAPAPTLVRPPYGATSSRVRDVVAGMGLYHVLWNIDPQDWRSGRSASTITDLVLRNLRDGGNVVMHDSSGNSANTIAALPRIIDGIRSRGYCLGTLGRTGKVVPPVPAARIGNVEVTEGAPGTTRTAYLDVTLSEPTSRSVSFDYATANGTAMAGSDYTATSGTLTIPRGATKRRIAVKVRGDALDEPNETFTVKLSKPSGATIARATGTVKILDDDPPPKVTVHDAKVAEGAAGTTATVGVAVKLSAPSGRTITVDYATADGTAKAGADYLAAAGTVTFKPGQTSRTIPVTIKGDALHEAAETFTVTLRNPSRVTISRATATVTIADDDPPPVLEVGDATVTEPAAGATTTVAVPVTLSTKSGRATTVTFTTVDGTATASEDYITRTETLTLAAGKTSAVVEVVVTGDGVAEGPEYFDVVLSSPSGATLGQAAGRVTIVDHDSEP